MRLRGKYLVLQAGECYTASGTYKTAVTPHSSDVRGV
jgi:hypothetical protein